MSLLGRRSARARATTWYLVQNEDGTIDVTKRGREVASGVTPARARAYLRAHVNRGDRVFTVAPDGYRTPLHS